MKTALIVGMGGLGNVSLNLLVSLGIGTIRIVDFDVVEESNLTRQYLFSTDDIGKAKVEVAKSRIVKRNPHVIIETYAVKADALNIETLLNNVDIVVDALDRFSSRRAIYRAIYKKKIPFIFSGAVGDTGNLMSFTQKEDNPCLFCLIGDVEDDQNQSCEILGVNPLILHYIAGIQISEVTKILIGQKGTYEDKMLVVEVEGPNFDSVKLKKNPDCRLCGINDNLDSGKVGEQSQGIRMVPGFGSAMITSLCGRNTFIFDPKWEINWSFKEIVETIDDEFKIKVKGENYVTFNVDEASMSLIESGVATIRGVSTSKDAINLVQNVFSKIVKN